MNINVPNAAPSFTQNEVTKLFEKLERKQNPNFNALKKVFCAIVDRKSVQLTLNTAVYILKYNLSLEMSIIDKGNMFLLMPFLKSLIYYIYSFPGWGCSVEYYSGKLSFKKWFRNFETYMNIKMRALVKNYNTFLNFEPLPMDPENNDEYQITLYAPKDDFQCFLSKDTLYFRQCLILPDEKRRCLMDLANVPFFNVKITTPHMMLSRKNVHRMMRWLTPDLKVCINNLPTSGEQAQKQLGNADIATIDSEKANHDSSIELCELTAYIDRLSAYSESTRKNNIDIANAIDCNIVIVKELLLDIKECLPLTKYVPCNMYLTHHIGKCNFIMLLNEIEAEEKDMKIHLVEKIKPSLQFGLHFVDVNKMKSDSLSIIDFLHSIEMECTACNLTFYGYNCVQNVLNHFQKQHVFRGILKCSKCEQNDTYYTLAKNRWVHICTSTT